MTPQATPADARWGQTIADAPDSVRSERSTRRLSTQSLDTDDEADRIMAQRLSGSGERTRTSFRSSLPPVTESGSAKGAASSTVESVLSHGTPFLDDDDEEVDKWEDESNFSQPSMGDNEAAPDELRNSLVIAGRASRDLSIPNHVYGQPIEEVGSLQKAKQARAVQDAKAEADKAASDSDSNDGVLIEPVSASPTLKSLPSASKAVSTKRKRPSLEQMRQPAVQESIESPDSPRRSVQRLVGGTNSQDSLSLPSDATLSSLPRGFRLDRNSQHQRSARINGHLATEGPILFLSLEKQKGRLGFNVSGGADNIMGCVFIHHVAPGSAAELGGLKQGDRVLELDGKTMFNVSHAEAVQGLKRTRNRVNLVIQRLDVGVFFVFFFFFVHACAFACAHRQKCTHTHTHINSA